MTHPTLFPQVAKNAAARELNLRVFQQAVEAVASIEIPHGVSAIGLRVEPSGRGYAFCYVGTEFLSEDFREGETDDVAEALIVKADELIATRARRALYADAEFGPHFASAA